MTGWTEVETPRILDADEAKALNGQKVAAAEPNVTKAEVHRDPATGEMIVAYLPIRPPAALRRAVTRVKLGGVQRSAMFRSASRTFGFAPRKPTMRRESCRYTSLAADDPDAEQHLEDFATVLGEALREIDPATATANAAVLDANVLPDWRIGESGLWTSGVINRTAQLPYHYDAFNYPTVSAMPVMRRGIRGGHLSIPEYGLTVECRDGWTLFFCGHDVLHGVTPMRAVAEDAYRVSVVYYALRGMKDCYTHAKEQEYGARRRTEREREMARRIAAGDLDIPVGRSKRKRKTEPQFLDPHAEHLIPDEAEP